MVTNKPNKRFIYIEDNQDGTCTMTFSFPEEDLFETMLFTFDMMEMFTMVNPEVSDEVRQLVLDHSVSIPSSPEEE